MKQKVFVLLLTAIATCTQVMAQSPNFRQWVGVWHAHVNGEPTDTLTLASDTGTLGGTIVLDMVNDEDGTPHVIASDPHVLLNPHLNGNKLSFQVRMDRPDGTSVTRSFTVTLESPFKADIDCLNCGPGAPAVVLSKDR